jgi:ectoine hydroxylase-related dioxygenase (phytanoyl-CoA dioxygenase family)
MIGSFCSRRGSRVVGLILTSSIALTVSMPPTSTTSSKESSPGFSCKDSESMKVDGYYAKKNLLSANEIDCILQTLSSEVADKIVTGKEISPGRHHYNMLPSTKFINSNEIKHLISGIVLPLSLTEMGSPHCDLMMTTLQIVDSAPGSAIQIWHADNAEKGITVIIPLIDLNDRNGPTELIAGSHNLLCNTWTKTAENRGDDRVRSKLSVVKPLLSAGDGLVVDARVLHRGGANVSETSRAILVIRFDNKNTQPPCMGVVGATFRLLLAKAIVILLDSHFF